MSKVSIRKRKDRYVFTNRLSYPETVNERVAIAIGSQILSGVFPVSVQKKWKDTQVVCEVNHLIPLNRYFSGLISQRVFLEVAYQIAEIIQNCEVNMLRANNLDLKSDRIFVDPYTKRVMCIYWPVVNNKLDEPPHHFLKQLPYNIHFNPDEKIDYISQYVSFFEGYSPFSVKKLLKLISALLGSKQPDSMLSSGEQPGKRSQDSLGNGLILPGGDAEYNPAAYQNNPSASALAGNTEQSLICYRRGFKNQVYGRSCVCCGAQLNNSLHEKIVQANIPPVIQKFDKPVNPMIYENSGTVVLGVQENDYPQLLQSRTGQSVSVNLPVFRVGKESTVCNFAIVDNTYISRVHIEIVKSGQKFFIRDTNSRNKTYLNGSPLQPQTEYELINGDHILLGNEELIYLYNS